MSQSPPHVTSTPTFYLTARQPVRPGVLLLAIAVAVGILWFFVAAMAHVRHARLSQENSSNAHSASAASQSDDDKDDPNQIDTIVLGDPADAPVPARHGDHVSPVHPTILIRLPRYGEQTGLIPDNPAGHLLYAWLAAFNHASPGALAEALPSAAPGPTLAAQLALRKETGGFALLSAKEVQPGVLVFRLRDQTPASGEVLGTLQVRPDSTPASIASFSLRAVVSTAQPSATDSPLNAPAASH